MFFVFIMMKSSQSRLTHCHLTGLIIFLPNKMPHCQAFSADRLRHIKALGHIQYACLLYFGRYPMLLSDEEFSYGLEMV
jgi:hypothetical protein